MTKKDLKIVGIIPAWGGSKLIPGRNIKPLSGNAKEKYSEIIRNMISEYRKFRKEK